MRRYLLIIILVFLNITVKGQLIIDNGAFLTEKEKSNLTQKIQSIKDKSTVETLIYTTLDLGDKSEFDYAMDLSLKYPVGNNGINNGIIILLSKNDRKLQILVGYGLEWILSNSQTQLIVDQMIPYFKKGEYFNGINKAIDFINQKVIDIDWKPYKLKELTDADNGKIFEINYSNKARKRNFIYAIDTDPQFSDEFKIKLRIDGKDFELYYSKYMNDLISKIITKNNNLVYFRLNDYKNRRLQLIGVE